MNRRLKAYRYRWIRHDGQHLRDIGINDDGTFFNPNGYPPELVRAAIEAADQRRHRDRSAAAKKAAETRRVRRELKVYAAAQQLLTGNTCGPRQHCAICGRGLDDPQSISRGIGAECWQAVLTALTSHPEYVRQAATDQKERTTMTTTDAVSRIVAAHRAAEQAIAELTDALYAATCLDRDDTIAVAYAIALGGDPDREGLPEPLIGNSHGDRLLTGVADIRQMIQHLVDMSHEVPSDLETAC